MSNQFTELATTLRWYVTNRWGVAESKAEALRLCDEIVGFPAKGAGAAATVPATPSPAPEKPKADPVLAYKVALVVGHNKSAPGAWVTGGGLSESEYDFNNKVADLAIADGIGGVEMKRFNRVANSSGYTREIAEVYGRVNAWHPDLVVEMHFNGGGGNYCFMLAASSSAPSIKLAGLMSAVFAEGLGIVNNGGVGRTRGERGGESLFSAKAPCVLTEPFFGDNKTHAETVARIGHRGVATLYRQAIAKVLTAI